MKFSVTSAAVSNISRNTCDEMENFALAGIKHVDFNFASKYFHPEKKNCTDSEFALLTENAVAFAQKHGIDFPIAHAPYLYNQNASEEEFELQVKDTVRAIKGCKFMNIDRLTVHAGHGFCASRDELYGKNTEFYSAILPYAEKYNVTVMIENISEKIYRHKFVIETAEDILEIKHRLNDHLLIRACWDTGHANLCELDQYREIKTLGENLFGVHMHDNFGYNDDHMAPLAGNVNFDEVVRAMKEVNYAGPFNFESKGFRSGDEWPNFRKGYTAECEKLLWCPDKNLVLEGLRTMKFIADYIMNKYNIFAE